MKKWCLGIGCFLVAMLAFAEESRFRAFTAADGRTLEARIVDYEPKSRKATLELRNGKKKSVNVSVFAEDDQPLFMDWFIQNEMLSPTKIVVKIVEKEATEGPSVPGTEGWNVQTMTSLNKAYEIQLDNKSHYAVPDLLIEYRIFYRRRHYEHWALVELGGGSFLNQGASSLGISDYLSVNAVLCEQGEIDMNTFPAKKRSNQIMSAGLKRGNEKRIDPLSGSLAVEKVRSVGESVTGVQVRISTLLSDGTRGGKVYAYPSGFDKKQKVDWSAGPRNGLYVVDDPHEKVLREKLKECASIAEGGGRLPDRNRYAAPELFFALKGWMFGYDEAPRRIGDMFMNGTNGVGYDEKVALMWYEVGADGKDLESLVQLAWYYGGNKDKTKRDADKAEEAADRLMKLKPKKPEHFAAAAAAYAEAGHFEAAVLIQKEVVKADDGKAQRESLKRYEQGLKYEA